VQAVIYGPDVALDMFSFAFDVKIGDATVLKFVPNSAAAGDALQAFVGQSIDDRRPSDGRSFRHRRRREQAWRRRGNGVANASAVIVTLTFQVQSKGPRRSRLHAPAPAVKDSTGATIGALTRYRERYGDGHLQGGGY
jgi:hypothetical protein